MFRLLVFCYLHMLTLPPFSTIKLKEHLNAMESPVWHSLCTFFCTTLQHSSMTFGLIAPLSRKILASKHPGYKSYHSTSMASVTTAQSKQELCQTLAFNLQQLTTKCKHIWSCKLVAGWQVQLHNFSSIQPLIQINTPAIVFHCWLEWQ